MREKHAVRLEDCGSLWLEDEGMLFLNRTVTDMDIINMHHRLREDRGELQDNQVRARRPAHLLFTKRPVRWDICFISLLLVRLIEAGVERIGKPYSYPIRVESLRKRCVSDVIGTNYLLVYCDRVIADLKDALGPAGLEVLPLLVPVILNVLLLPSPVARRVLPEMGANNIRSAMAWTGPSPDYAFEKAFYADFSLAIVDLQVLNSVSVQ